jgi:hypothetical protein
MTSSWIMVGEGAWNGSSPTGSKSEVFDFFVLFWFLVGLGFELRASCLQ